MNDKPKITVSFNYMGVTVHKVPVGTIIKHKDVTMEVTETNAIMSGKNVVYVADMTFREIRACTPSNKWREAKRKEPRPIRLIMRERKIVEALARGFSQQAVANHMGLSISTIRHHLSDLRMQTRARDTVELLSILRSRGVIK